MPTPPYLSNSLTIPSPPPVLLFLSFFMHLTISDSSISYQHLNHLSFVCYTPELSLQLLISIHHQCTIYHTCSQKLIMLLQDLKFTFGGGYRNSSFTFQGTDCFIFIHLVLLPTKDQNCFLLSSKSWFVFSTILLHISCFFSITNCFHFFTQLTILNP